MKKILVVTGTRAEYGLLYWTMKRIQEDNELDLQLIVTGTHLCPDFGFTVKQIENDGFKVDEKIDMIISSVEKSSIVKSMGLEMIQISQALDRLKPDMLLILGDRYETFVAATCAMMMNIPIAHMNGGESTEGAIDEQIRHAITKISHLHFAGAEYYKNIILKMGEESWRVYNVGQSGVESIRRLKLLSKNELEKQLSVTFFSKPIFLVTYHPETLNSSDIIKNINNLLEALKEYDAQIIFTYPNADFGGNEIIGKINNFQKQNKNCKCYFSLGQLKYLSLLKFADVMIGNSSSGIIEAPIFNLPVVNIGTRQNGRVKTCNIIDCKNDKKYIKDAIDKALSNDFKQLIKKSQKIEQDKYTSEIIVNVLKDISIDEKFMMKKLSY